MIDKTGYVIKAVLLLAAGIILIFFPGVITYGCYIIGGLVILTGLFMFFQEPGDGTPILGFIVGAIICALPFIISTILAIATVIVLGILGIIKLTKALSSNTPSDKKIFNGISAAILFILAFSVLLNPFNVSNFARIVLGGLFIAMSAYNFYIVHVIKQRGLNSGSSNIIDIDSFTVHDDHNR